MTEDELLEAVTRFYSDTSRSRAETKEVLENLITELEMLISTLDD